MARDEAKVRVRLDTRQAKGELRGLTKEGGRAAGRVGSGLRRTLGRGLGVLGVGVGVGAGMAALRGPTQGAISSMASQLFGAFGQRLRRGLLGERQFRDMGRAQAVNEIAQEYGSIVGRLDEIPKGFESMFKFRSRRYAETAEGMNRILSDTRFRSELAQDIDEAGKSLKKASVTLWQVLENWWKGRPLHEGVTVPGGGFKGR